MKITDEREKLNENDVFELVDDDFEMPEGAFVIGDDSDELPAEFSSEESEAEQTEPVEAPIREEFSEVASVEVSYAATEEPAPQAAPKEDRFANIRQKFESNVDYTTVLDGFEGPLDLLLYLVNREEIEIKDIFVSQVTEQFLEYMKGLPYLDVDKVTDYLNIAATLIKIKAQSLVPILDEMDEYYDDDIEDDKAELIRALEEYRLIKQEMDKLKELETIGYFFKEPDKDVTETKTVFSLDKLTLDGLVKAMSALLIKRADEIEEENIREIPRDEYTVAQKILFILEVFETAEETRFEELFTRDFTRAEIVTTFQALLELLKHQYLHIRQPEAFGQIYISFNPESPHTWVGQQIDEYE